MSVDIWIDEVSKTIQETQTPLPLYNTVEDLKENRDPASPLKRKIGERLGRMADEDEEQIIPRPSKKRNLGGAALGGPSGLPSSPSLHSRSESSNESDAWGSHQSGRISPTKQLGQLKDSDNPLVFCDFEAAGAQLPLDVESLYDNVQRLADGHGILSGDEQKLAADQKSAQPLSRMDAKRFEYPSAIDRSGAPKLGAPLPLRDVQTLVAQAVACEGSRAPEADWNSEVHSVILQKSLASSIHADKMIFRSIQTAKIDPKHLAPAAVPNRIIDYCYVLQPEQSITDAWSQLKPLPQAGIKSWNNTTQERVRETPIAINIETKTSDKSWTDGKAQLGIWITSLFNRLRLLPQYDQIHPLPDLSLKIPAMPLIVVQGHDWHMLIVSQKVNGQSLKTTVWQMINMGSTRNCFDTYKVLAILQVLIDWANTVWRPWFCTLLEKRPPST